MWPIINDAKTLKKKTETLAYGYSSESTHLRVFSHRFLKSSKPCLVGIYWTALTEYTQVITHVRAKVSVIFQIFFTSFCMAKLATSSMRVKTYRKIYF